MKIHDLSVKYANKVVLDKINVEFPEHKVTCVLGASGCGKTTLLNCIADLIFYRGEIEKESKNVSYVFQNPLLLPHMTVRENIKLVLENQFNDSSLINKTADDILKKVGLYEVRNNFPNQLSGGMAQRASLARGFVYPADILLMDEPFKGMDLSLYKRIIALFKYLHEQYKKTTVLVTHDINEALSVGDKIILIGDKNIAYSVDLQELNEKGLLENRNIKDEIGNMLLKYC